MMRSNASGRVDRVLAAIEVLALGIWVGAMAGFAFAFAPLAFRIVAPLDMSRFATLTASVLQALTMWGYVLGGIAILTAILRAVDAGDRTWDIGRAVLVALALGLATVEQRAIVPQMQATLNVASPEYRALHQHSSELYGGALLLAAAALALAASRRDA